MTSSERRFVEFFVIFNRKFDVIFDVIGGSWSSILFSLDVAAGLWPLLREGLRPSRLRPGALTRPCAS